MSANILIVEDEIFVALEMQGILEDRGYSVVGIAADIDGAMEYADRDIDVAFVDLNLRDGLTGPQIGSRLANDHHASVLFVTANPRLLGDGVAGTIGVLTKPTDEDGVIRALEFGLARRRGEAVEPPNFVRCFG